MKYLSGSGNFGKKKQNNSNNNFNLYVPSNRTLDSYEDTGYYPFPPPAEVSRIQATASAYSKKSGCNWHIIAFDRVYTKKKYEFNANSDFVLGGEKAYSPEEFLAASDDDCVMGLGKEVIQFYLQNIDSGYFEPIGHIAKADGTPKYWIHDKLQELVTMYNCEDIKIIGSSSDGDLFDSDIEFKMDTWNRKHNRLF